MLPKEDRISYKAMLDIPLPGICYPRKTEKAKGRCKKSRFQVYAAQGRQNKLKSDVRNSASRYTLPKEDNKRKRDVRNSASR